MAKSTRGNAAAAIHGGNIDNKIIAEISSKKYTDWLTKSIP